jgi:DNA-binding MarR family transcriptional regulator
MHMHLSFMQAASIPCFCAHLRRASRAVTRAYEAELRAHGLAAGQYSLLLAIHNLPQVRQRDLGKLFSMDSTTLTRTLAGMSRAGWLSAAPGEDRRERCFTLTEQGRTLLGEARVSWNRAQKKLEAALGPSLWSTLRQDLIHATTAAEALAAN